MPLIEWLDEYNINVTELDEQHKRIAEIINKFYESLQANKGETSLNKILDDVLAKVASHFTREETIMELYGYPEYGVCKEEHDILSKEVTMMFKGDIKDKNDKFTKIAFFLKDWFIDHTVQGDKELGEYLNKKGVT